jgi:DNA-directed RNA polymerase specialized sigma24 family protein
MTQEKYGNAYQQGFRKTVRLLRSRGASWENAEDLAQTAWLRGWQKVDQLRNEGIIVSWVNAIAVNYHRYASQHEARYQALPELCGKAGIDLAAIDAARILRLCRPRDRALLEQQMGGFTAGEMAGKQGVSATAMRLKLLRARRAVRATVEGRASELRESFRIQECAAAS